MLPINIVKLYELPEALSKYIQEKGASGVSGLNFIPWVFPVFIMNPAEYSPPMVDLPFKEALHDHTMATATNTVKSTVVPEGEVWKVTNIFCRTTGTANPALLSVKKSVTEEWWIHHDLSVQYIKWKGEIWLNAGDWIEGVMPSGNLHLYLLGVKQYA